MAALPLFSQAELSELDNQRRTQYQPAWISRTGPPTEYSPSEPTIELVNLQTSRTSIDITTTFLIGAGGPTPWHPKLTLYRLLVILSTVGVGVAKEVTSYLNLTYASITLEWILGVVLFLVLYILGIFELTYTRRLAWFFEFDYLDYWWKFLYQFAGTHRPSYTSDENNTGDDFSDHPPMTGYRLLITSTVFGVGITKSVLVYGNRQTEATTVECVIGIFVATGLYWLGLYEASSTKVYPAFFHIDYSPGITYLLTTGSNIAWFSLHLIGMALAAGLTCAFSFLVYVIYSTDYSTPTLPPIIGLINKAFFMSVPILVSATGLRCIFMLGENLYKHSEPFHASPIGRYLAKFPALVIFKEIHEKYWLPDSSYHQRERFFYLKRVLIRQVIKLPGNVYLLLLFVLCLIACIFLSTHWIFLLIPYLGSLWVIAWLLASVIVLPAIGIFSYMTIHACYAGVREFVADVKQDGSID